MKNILFYGDSNTWGFNPENCRRYAYEERWTTICAEKLGPDYLCIPAGMNGRTTVHDDPWKGSRNGVSGLDYELQTHKPLDLCVIMLGTNDLKFTDAFGSARGMEHLIRMVMSANERYHLSSPVFPDGPRILLISPVLLRNNIGCAWENVLPAGVYHDIEESAKLTGLYQDIAVRLGTDFLDASRFAEPSPVDGVHLGRDGHQALGTAIADTIRRILPA